MSLGATGALPREFRLFVHGLNDTEKGTFLFDEQAAQSVMENAARWGVDYAIDLEHQMLDGACADPTARDARGWFRLELRPDGSLWAVDVRWTADGEARLLQKRQRYISPAALFDPETMRITEVLNAALVSMPATRNAPALVAASKGSGMDLTQVKAALDAIEAGDAAKCGEILKAMIAAAASGSSAEDAAPASGAPVEESAVPPAAKGDAPPDAEKKGEVAASAKLARLTGKPTLAEGLAEVEVWRAAYVENEKATAKLAAEREALDSAERKRLCTDLIKLGAEFPATVWTDDKATALKPRWAKMPLEELRASVTEQRTARGAKPAAGTGAKPPAGSGDGSATFVVGEKHITLSAAQLAICAETNCKPEKFAAQLARRASKE